MARNVLVPINMSGNEIRNSLVHNLATDPVSPVESQIWYNTTDHVLRIRKNGSTQDLGSVSSIAATAVTYAGGTNLAASSVEVAIDTLDANKAPAASPTFTGTVAMAGATDVTVPTPLAADNDTSAANTAWVKARIADLVASSPAALDTLNELAAALGNDANFATTVTTALGTKAGKFTAANVGGATSQVITHNLGTRSVVVSVHDATTFDEIDCDVQKTTTNTVTLGFAVAPAANSYVVTVIG